MFRRRTDFSWPLILILGGLFFLSLKLPRQWERIARPTALALKPHRPQTTELSSATDSRPEVSPLEAFQTIKPAGQVASNTDGLADSAPATNDEARPTVIAPVAAPESLAPEVVPVAAPAEEPVKVVVLAETPKDGLTPASVPFTPSTSGRPVVPPTQDAEKDIASMAAERTDEVRVLRDVPTPETGPSLHASRPNLKFGVCRRRTPQSSRTGRPNIRVKVPSGSSTSAVHRGARTVSRSRAVARDCGNGSQSPAGG